VSVLDTLRTLSDSHLRDLGKDAAADGQSSPEAKQRLAEHITREQQRRTQGR
jgi:hypothetical protein